MLQLSEKIKSVPAIKPLIAFTLGIIFQIYSGINLSGSRIYILLGIPLVFSTMLYFLFLAKKMILVPSVIIYLNFLLAGIAVSFFQNIKHQSPGKGIYIAEVVSLPVRKPKTTFIKLRLLAASDALISVKHKHFIHAYFSGNDENEWPGPGEILFFHSNLSDIQNPGNPNEFDYAGYLSRKKVFSSCFIKEGCWQSLGNSPKKRKIQIYALKLKEKLQHYIRQTANSKGGLNYEVMLAICTGDKSELDRDLKASYSKAGAIHVMAVSGLHVGMIWAFLGYLTFYLRKNTPGMIIQFFILMSVLWFYALLTGLSASVVRSCMMFTLASASNLLKRNKGIYNSLFIAALIQLTADPLLIFDAGFQLSYSAVLSILLFQPILASIFHFSHSIPKRLLELISVSISAQILTFPLSVYYFHQFPVYFILTNVLIIPLVTALMIGFLTSVILIFIPIVSENLVFLSLITTQAMNDCIAFINRLPGSLIKNLNFSHFQISLILLATMIFLRFVLTRKLNFLKISLLLFVLVCADGIKNYIINHRDSICVFNIKGSTAIEIHAGKDHFLFCNDSLISEDDMAYSASGYRISRYYTKPREILSTDNVKLSCIKQVALLPGSGNFTYLYKKMKITVFQDVSILDTYKPAKPLFTDLLIIGGREMPPFHKLNTFLKFNKVIISSSFPEYVQDLQESDSLGRSYHRISFNGAFVFNF